jgi:methylmalonyl-CoA/ethylmalonyl-CoA epimerase
MKNQERSVKIDHVAIAVISLDKALDFYVGILGFELIAKREVAGKFSGMKSAELNVANGFSIVLVQGTEPESQVCRYIEEYGPGVQHLAFEVENVEEFSEKLKQQGVAFSTTTLYGRDLIQIFTKRDKNSGMMLEFIQRDGGCGGFEEQNIEQLFKQLEESGAY